MSIYREHGEKGLEAGKLGSPFTFAKTSVNERSWEDWKMEKTGERIFCIILKNSSKNCYRDAEIWSFFPLKGGWAGDGQTPVRAKKFILSYNHEFWELEGWNL